MVQRSKDCHNEVIISSLQEVILRHLKYNTWYLCNQGSVEDEAHFLLNCQCHTDIRDYELGVVLNDQDFSNKSDDDKLSILLNDFVRRTAQFLLKAFLHRRSILYT